MIWPRTNFLAETRSDGIPAPIPPFISNRSGRNARLLGPHPPSCPEDALLQALTESDHPLFSMPISPHSRPVIVPDKERKSWRTHLRDRRVLIGGENQSVSLRSEYYLLAVSFLPSRHSVSVWRGRTYTHPTVTHFRIWRTPGRNVLIISRLRIRNCIADDQRYLNTTKSVSPLFNALV